MGEGAATGRGGRRSRADCPGLGVSWPAHARAPNSIYILIKTAPLASPTPTRPATTPNPPPIHPTPVFLFVKASTIKYISVRNVGEAVRSPVRRRDLQVRPLCFNQLSLRALLTRPHLPILRLKLVSYYFRFLSSNKLTSFFHKIIFFTNIHNTHSKVSPRPLF